MKTACALALAACLLVSRPGNAQASAPQVSATVPHNGDQSVAPDLKEVVVTFDQDMAQAGFSFMGGGPTFPKVAGKPFWRTAHECVLPVQLNAGQAYTIGLNDRTHTNFQNTAGAPAVPFTLTFKTGGGGGGGPAVTASVQAESIRQLREALEHQYSLREVRVVDWEEVWPRFEPRLAAAKSAREFAEIAGEMLAATRDPHIWLTVDGQIVPAFQFDARPELNVNFSLLPHLVTGWKQPHPMVASGQAAPGIGYLAIHSWERKYAPALLETALAAFDGFHDSPGLILDLRLNGGGDETIARQFAGCFIQAPTKYARHMMLDPSSPTGFAAPVERSFEPTPGHATYQGRVAVLMGRANLSSAEAFLLMMQQVPGVLLIGDHSLGASGNPQPHLLANGVTVFLPSWKAMLLDGTSIETKGLTPTVEIKTTPADFAQRDPVLEKAVELLGRRK